MEKKIEKELAFELAIKRLEDIVKKLEDGNAPLDDSLKLFEEGVGLVLTCKTQLDGAEQRVKFLTENGENADN